jgi:hypothetical protein
MEAVANPESMATVKTARGHVPVDINVTYYYIGPENREYGHRDPSP